ncbi:MAG: response regulator [Gemmatimonadetes bacterium]|nr:response regulator [Gemmatimonadota bacterium]
MAGRRRSIQFVFPALIVALVLASSAVTTWAAREAIVGALYREVGGQLLADARRVAATIAEGVPGIHARARLLAGASPSAEILLAAGDGSTPAAQARFVGDTARAPVDSGRTRLQLLDTLGALVIEHRFREGTPAPRWAAERAQSRALSRDSVAVSPILPRGERAAFEVAAPVRLASDGRFLGWVVESRLIEGRGAAAIRQLVGVPTLLIGAIGDGVWTDLGAIVEPPPVTSVLDSVVPFADGARGTGIGAMARIAGTSWNVWVESPRADVLAPAAAFTARMAQTAALVALLTALFAWLYTRWLTRRIGRLTTAIEQAPFVPDAAEPGPHGGADEIGRLERAYHALVQRITDQQKVEAEVVQAQKLEAVGRLAGGLAHDFNNVLTVVTNYGELVQGGLEPGTEAHRDAQEVLNAAQRASVLTRQLLAFSRGQVVQPRRLDLNAVIEGAERMLVRLIPSQVEFATELDPALEPVEADRGQLEQVLVNLALNAVDAMPHGGRLLFRTTMASLDRSAEDSSSVATPFVQLMVRDSGVGMPREVVSHIFEPFYSTKAPGKGTGLGLASVHGIVTQMGGRIHVYSEPGRGTTFKLFFPVAVGPAEPNSGSSVLAPTARATGLVLLVEDDPDTREATRRVLRHHGYSVATFDSGAALLARLATDDRGVGVVLTDVMMPGMTGFDLAKRVAERWPQIPVILMSGYADIDLRTTHAAEFPCVILEKPFSSAKLFEAIAGAIASGRQDGGDTPGGG